MQTVTVTIGRNVNDSPLPQEEWNLFVADVRRAVDIIADELWVVAPYHGEWNGVHEDAVIFHASVANSPLAHPAVVVDGLRQRLATLASYYRQDAIGLAVGESELVESFVPADLVTS